MNTQSSSDGGRGKQQNTKNSSASEPPSNIGARTELITKKSAVPIWAAAAVWIISALFFPMYRMYHYIIILALSIAVAIILEKVIPPKKEYVEIPEALPDTGNADLDSMITEIRSASLKLESARASIEKNHPETSSLISEISRTITKISALVEEKPQDLPLIRRFMNYYLPTTLKLIEKYTYLDSQNEAGLSNIESTMKNIDDVLKTVNQAMKKQLDALFADDALDISTDIEVLESMLARDGLK